MVKDIVTDKELLSQKCEKATPEDAQVFQDLVDTFEEHQDECVCMAANMIGYLKRVIVIASEEGPKLMVNPAVIDKKQAYFAQEECLSRPDGKPRGAKRYKRVKVKYVDADFAEHEEVLDEFSSQCVLHCVDHCNGVVI